MELIAINWIPFIFIWRIWHYFGEHDWISMNFQNMSYVWIWEIFVYVFVYVAIIIQNCKRFWRMSAGMR